MALTRDDLLDPHIDKVLRGAGSALRHYTMEKSVDEMRAAMRGAMDAAIADFLARTGQHVTNDASRDAAIAEAVAAERAACIKVLEDGWFRSQRDAVAALAARGKP